MTLDPLAALAPDKRATWRLLAACSDAQLMFDPDREAEAKRICRGCPVRVECLAFALSRPEPEGVWGGFNPQERRDMTGAQSVEEFHKVISTAAQPNRSRTRRA